MVSWNVHAQKLNTKGKMVAIHLCQTGTSVTRLKYQCYFYRVWGKEKLSTAGIFRCTALVRESKNWVNKNWRTKEDKRLRGNELDRSRTELEAGWELETWLKRENQKIQKVSVIGEDRKLKREKILSGRPSRKSVDKEELLTQEDYGNG